MNWLLFYLLAALHPVAFVMVGVISAGWRLRILLWALLPLPALWFCWDYFAIKRQHAEMCSEVAGLRILVQPEKTDRVRLVGRRFAQSARSVLEEYYPNVKVVEAMTQERSLRGDPLDRYVSHASTPNPSAGRAMTSHPWREPAVVITESRIEFPGSGIFELTEQTTTIEHGQRTETRLTKDGRLYAIHTTLVHWWTGIHYPDALPTWRCPDTNRPSPPKVNLDAIWPPRTVSRFAHSQLLDLIFP